VDGKGSGEMYGNSSEAHTRDLDLPKVMEKAMTTSQWHFTW